jgi:hydrogenase maturation protease
LFRVIGIGNPLMGDDGLGIVAVECLRQMEPPPGVEAIDGGTGGLTLLELFEGAQRVILVDAVDMGKAPGTVVRLALPDLLSVDPALPLSWHAAGVLPALRLGHELSLLPPLWLFGMQPSRIAPGIGLSPAVAAALPELLATLLAFSKSAQ